MTKKRYTSDIHRIYDNNEEIACADTMDDAEIFVDRLNEQDARIKELETVIQQILYETRANHTKREYSIIVWVSSQMYDKLNDLLREKMW